MRKLSSPLRHDAVRDTMWVAKAPPAAFLTILGVVAGAVVLAYLLH
jgi:hypothetical protein